MPWGIRTGQEDRMVERGGEEGEGEERGKEEVDGENDYTQIH